MATAEKLLHQAQYAFQSISFGESRENKRNVSRAKSLCKKIIRKFPATMEAGEAHSILRRLGEEAYTSVHAKPAASSGLGDSTTASGDLETLDWNGLFALLFDTPRIVLGIIVFAGLILFGIFGPFIFAPLILFVLLTGPFRRSLKQEQRDQLNAFIVKVNEYIVKQRQG